MDNQRTKLNLRTRAKEKNITRQQIAEHCHVSVQAVNKWWYGYGMPSLETFILLSELLECSVNDIVVM